MTIRLAAMAATAALLASCRTAQPYVPPVDGETAKLLIRPAVPAGMSFGIYAFGDAHACGKPQRIVVGGANTGNQSSSLRAGPLATLEYIGLDRTRSCVIGFSFYPKAHHRYLLATSQDGASCGVQLLDATDGDNPRPEKSVVRRTMRSGGCAPLNQNLRAGSSINETYMSAPKDGMPGGADKFDDFKDLLPK
jgi:hypothetical protein